jgi:uncharacterized protein with GYD domain
VPSYVALINYTDQGIHNFKDSPDRADAAAAQLEKMGGRFKDVYWTLGAYDIVVVMEAPDDETVTAFALGLGSQGNVRTQTLRAFDSDEMRGLIAKGG